jgi:hypothetical protein
MSGGHFNYEDSQLLGFADQLEQDIKFNDVKFVDTIHADSPFGYQLQPETLEYVKLMVKDLRKLGKLLHEYDWFVSDDTSEERFLDEARALYKTILPG